MAPNVDMAKAGFGGAIFTHREFLAKPREAFVRMGRGIAKASIFAKEILSICRGGMSQRQRQGAHFDRPIGGYRAFAFGLTERGADGSDPVAWIKKRV